MMHRIDGAVFVNEDSLEDTVKALIGIGVGAVPAPEGNQIAFSFYVRDYAEYERIAGDLRDTSGVSHVQYASSARLVADHLRLEARRDGQSRPVRESYDE